MSEDLDDELRHGDELATALVDHLLRMGNASKCLLPVEDRAEEYVVIVMPKDAYERREWPIEPLRRVTPDTIP